MDKHGQPESNIPTLDKFHEIEMGALFDAVQGELNRGSQLATLFGTASLAVLGIAFSTQKAGLFFLAAAMLWIYLGIAT